jgi:hypothetical protein
MEQGKKGMLEEWNNGLKTRRPGIMGYWNDGIMG